MSGLPLTISTAAAPTLQHQKILHCSTILPKVQQFVYVNCLAERQTPCFLIVLTEVCHVLILFIIMQAA